MKTTPKIEPKEAKKSGLFEMYLKLQQEIKNPTKDTQAFKYKYAQLPDILEMIKPILGKYRFVMYSTCLDNSVVVSLRYVDTDEAITGALPIPDYGGDAQKLGSFITYARRYLTLALLNISGQDEDDDGKSTVGVRPMQKAQQFTEPKPGDTKIINGVVYTFTEWDGKTSGKIYKGWVPPKESGKEPLDVISY